jgi:hypothetical protein
MVSGAQAGLPAMSGLAALLFALSIASSAVLINRGIWQREASAVAGELVCLAARRNARLMALGYAWGGAAMLSIYTLTGLRWQHAWQYGLTMTLFAVGLLAYGAAIRPSDSPLRRPNALGAVFALTVLQGAGAALGLAFLVMSGKIWGHRSDWAANHIFFAGGLALVAISAIAAYTQHRIAPPWWGTPSRQL